MVRIRAELDERALLRSCSVKGHAQSGPMGHDLVCAAVSVLARTAVTVLQNAPDVAVRVEAPKRGELYFETEYTEAGAAFLSATGAFLMEGFRSVAAEYPVNCKIELIERRRK